MNICSSGYLNSSHQGHQKRRPPLLLRLLAPLLPLPLPLRIDLGRKGILEPQRNLIRHPHQPRQQQTRRFPKPQRRPGKAHRAAVIHRRRRHVEREPGHHLIHEDAEVIPQVRPRDPEGPHAREDEDIAAGDEGDGEALRERGLQERVRGLGAQGAFVEGVAQDAEREDGEGEGVAAVERFAAGELGEGFVVVFAAGGDVPEGRVEDDGGGGNWKGGSSLVDWGWLVREGVVGGVFWAVRTVQRRLAEIDELGCHCVVLSMSERARVVREGRKRKV